MVPKPFHGTLNRFWKRDEGVLVSQRPFADMNAHRTGVDPSAELDLETPMDGPRAPGGKMVILLDVW